MYTYIVIYTYTYILYVCVWYSLEWLTGSDPASLTTAVSQWQVQKFIMLDASTGCRNPKQIHSRPVRELEKDRQIKSKSMPCI